jgi:hypothetical protein
MACLGFVTFLPLRPLCSLPRLNSCISRFTSSPALGLYFLPELLLEVFFEVDFFDEAFFDAVFFDADFLLVLFFAGALRLLLDEVFFEADFLSEDFLLDFFAAFLVAMDLPP